jgi:hypothetical protein
MRTATASHLDRLGPTASRAMFTRWELFAGVRSAALSAGRGGLATSAQAALQKGDRFTVSNEPDPGPADPTA